MDQINVKDARPREPRTIVPNGMITRYEITSHYGGPEEGGWWYDRDEAKEVVLVFDESASTEQQRVVAVALNTLERKLREERGDRPEHQGGPPTIHYSIENEYGSHDNMNEPRPHYE